MSISNRKYTLKLEYGVMQERIVNYSVTLPLPSIIDLRSKISVTYDQQQLDSCTANALCYSFIFNDKLWLPSRLFLYYNERLLNKDISQDVGSTLSEGIIALETYGLCSEKLWPYIENKFTDKPSMDAYAEATQHKVLTAYRVQQTMASMKGCLINGFPFVVGIQVYSSFETDVVTNTGYIPMPNIQTEQLLGGHAVICLGYNDTKGVWIMKNSWGPSWGDNGYFYLPYNYLLSNKLTGDIWQINKVHVLNTPQKISVNRALESSKHLGKYR